MMMVEKIARAIAQVDHNGRIADEGYWLNRDTGSDHHREQARAALRALLEPSEGMWGAEFQYDDGDSGLVSETVHNEAWQAMIQAALNEKEG